MNSRPRMRASVVTSCRWRAASHSCSTVKTAAAVRWPPGIRANTGALNRAAAAKAMCALGMVLALLYGVIRSRLESLDSMKNKTSQETPDGINEVAECRDGESDGEAA